ncbi:MAG: pilus assembly protein PilM [Acidaminobacteraceae bacterium]
MAKDLLCVEIGNNKTKIVYGTFHNNLIDVKSYIIYSNSDKTFNYEGGLNINEVFPQLMGYFKKMKVRRKNTYITLPNENTVVRTRELPRVKIKELSQMIKFEAEQFLPYNIEEFYIDFKVLEEIETDEALLINTVIVAVPKGVVDDHVKLLDKTKQKIKVMSPYTDAVNSYASAMLTSDDTNIMIADIGEKFINMSVYQGANYYASINSEIGVKNIVDIFSAKESLETSLAHDVLFGKLQLDDIKNEVTSKTEDFEAANMLDEDIKDDSLVDFNALTNELEDTDDGISKMDKLRRRMEILSNGQVEMDEVKKATLNESYYEIFRELNRMVDFFRTRKFGTTLDVIYLCGGGANLTNLKEYLANVIGIDVKSVDEVRQNNLGIKAEDYNLLVSALGSALGR